MIKIKEKKIKDRAFLLQFLGNNGDVERKLGIDNLRYFIQPVKDMEITGLFGIIDALMDLKLTKDEIKNFYMHNHIEPYTDPYEFTKGIIDIVYGLSKTEIKNKYGDYFNDKCIEKLSNSNKNTKMLMSFCYDKDDLYMYIPNKDELFEKFYNEYDNYDINNSINEKHFLKIDGKLFRAVRFLVRHGYDFPEIDSLFNEQIKDIIFKQTNGNNTFVLNKKYIREMSNSLLSLVILLEINDYKLLNQTDIFSQQYNNNVTLINPKGEQIEFNCSYLDTNLDKYLTDVLVNLSYNHFYISDKISLCDKRINNIKLSFLGHNKQTLTIKRDTLLDISLSFSKWFDVIKESLNLDFIFPDNDNLFNINQKDLKISDATGTEYIVDRNQLASMLEIINRCRQNNFDVNLYQLFDPNKNIIELCDIQGRKAFINRDLIIHMINTFSLLTSNGYSFKDYDSLLDEKNPYIVCYDEQNKKRLLSRKQIEKIMKIQMLPNKRSKDLTDKEKDLLLMINDYRVKKKLFKWLPYTAKKWIPSSSVINKIPAEKSQEYFYNNNHSRLKVLKDKYQANSYDEMEGIISLGYILGLFDSKESTSKKAMNYIIDYFFKKGITANELHKTYGAIDLKKDYDKRFADFFMKHYSINCEAFIEPDLGTNMVGELFERFDEVLKNRPEKIIKTRTINKLLTPIDAMSSITNVEIDKEILGEKANDERYINLAQLLLKFGASSDELKWAIQLYEQALAIDEQEVKIPQIEDLKYFSMRFNSHLKSDPHAFISGKKTNCCSKYGGYAQDRLTHIITDPNWRYVTFTSPSRTFFDGLVWYDEEEQVVCIDNVEGQFSKCDKNNTNAVAMMADAVIRYADGIYSKMNELNIPCKKVNVGKDPGTESSKIFSYAEKQKLIYDDNNPCNYPEKNNITTDAHEQYTITDEKILRLRKK